MFTYLIYSVSYHIFHNIQPLTNNDFVCLKFKTYQNIRVLKINYKLVIQLLKYLHKLAYYVSTKLTIKNIDDK